MKANYNDLFYVLILEFLFCKVRTTRHRYAEFGPKPGEIKNTLKKSTLGFNRGSVKL
jgi:hypothetical protein